MRNKCVKQNRGIGDFSNWIETSILCDRLSNHLANEFLAGYKAKLSYKHITTHSNCCLLPVSICSIYSIVFSDCIDNSIDNKSDHKMVIIRVGY